MPRPYERLPAHTSLGGQDLMPRGREAYCCLARRCGPICIGLGATGLAEGFASLRARSLRGLSEGLG